MTPDQRTMRRLEWRWEKDLPKWSAAALRIQRVVGRGVKARRLIYSQKVLKATILSCSKLVVQAGQLLATGDFAAAVDLTTKAIVRDPHCKIAYLVRGRALFAVGDLPGSVNDLTTCLMVSDPSSQSWGGGGIEVLRMRVLLGDLYHRAQCSPEKFLRHIIGTLRSTYQSAFELSAEKDRKATPKEMIHLVRIAALANRGRAHQVSGAYHLSVEDYTEVMESRGERCDIPMMHFLRGMAYARMHAWPAALEDFDLNCRLEPNDVDAKIRRAGAYGALQDWKNAYEDLTAVLDVRKADPRVLCLRGRLLCCMRKWKDAAEDYRKALSVNRNFEDAKIGLAQCEMEHVPLPLLSLHDS